MTEAEIRERILLMYSNIRSMVTNIKWNLASLGEPRTRYIWLQGNPILIWLNDYLSHWWFETGQIWFDDIDIMVNAVGRTIYELYQNLLQLELQLDTTIKTNLTIVAREVRNVLQRIITYAEGEFDLIEDWVSLSIDYLYQYIDTEVTQVYIDIDAITAEVMAYVDAEIAEIFIDIDADLAEVREYVDAEIVAYSATVDVLFSDLYADLDENVEAIEASIASLASDAMQWIIDKVGAVWDWLTDTGNDIYQWINRQVSDLTNYVSQWVLDITTYVNNLAADVAAAFSAVYSTITQEISGVIVYVNNVVDSATAVLQDALDVINRGLDWSNLFFNLALAIPEFGMLSVMTKDDEDFDAYKPFWQAFLSRILTT